MLDNTWIPIHYGMRWHIHIHKTVWSYQHIVTNCNFSDNSGVYSYPHLIAYRWSTFLAPSVGLANNNTLVNIAISAYCGFSINSDIICVA